MTEKRMIDADALFKFINEQLTQVISKKRKNNDYDPSYLDGEVNVIEILIKKINELAKPAPVVEQKIGDNNDDN